MNKPTVKMITSCCIRKSGSGSNNQCDVLVNFRCYREISTASPKASSSGEISLEKGTQVNTSGDDYFFNILETFTRFSENLKHSTKPRFNIICEDWSYVIKQKSVWEGYRFIGWTEILFFIRCKHHHIQ